MKRFKGVKGGDPSMRPEKVMLTYPCPTCKKPTTALVDTGKMGKHECDDCRKLRNQRQLDALYIDTEPCKGCGTYKNVIYAPETFNAEVYGDHTYVSLCAGCRHDYAQDI
jgi:hypothetical protein